MQRTGAAEGDERVIARIVAPCSQGNPHGAFHRGVDDLDRARRRVLDARAEPVGERLDRRARELDVEREAAREREVRASADREPAGSP